MTQPSFVHESKSDSVRPTQRLSVAKPWTQSRVAELSKPGQPSGHYMGYQGPDQGYAISLANSFEEELVTNGPASKHDAITGCVQVALRRASLFGRAPCRTDLEFAFTLFGFIGEAPESLTKARDEWFAGCDHDYWSQRAIADLVSPEVLKLSLSDLKDKMEDWTKLISIS